MQLTIVWLGNEHSESVQWPSDCVCSCRLPGRKARHQLDEYDQEYDKGMTKKRKGITNVSWQSSTGSLKPKQFERRRPQKQP